jgi:DNA-binding transcriptional LysR family regulator
MELRHLRYFVAVAETENVSRAALRLHVSQPALSRQVRDLEDELGFPLLERTPKSVRLTAAGRLFLGEVRNLLGKVEEAVQSARAVATGERGELHVGYAPSPTLGILPSALRAFQAVRPGVRVKLHDLSTEEMLAGLREGRLSFAFLVQPTGPMLRELHFQELMQIELCLAVSPRHPFARLRSVPAARLAGEPLAGLSRKDYPEYYENLDTVFAGMKIRPRVVEEHDSITGIVAAVEAGGVVAVVPQALASTVGTRLRILPFSPKNPRLIVGAAWPKAGATPAAMQFLECVKQVITPDAQPYRALRRNRHARAGSRPAVSKARGK